jgi:hypothetical protein
MTKKENNKKPLYELFFNIVLPVILLNKLSSKFGDDGPVIALFVALAFPIGYFFWDWIKSKHVSIVSILGFVNILLTGCFALYDLNSFWFAVKESSIPLLIGLGVTYTAFTTKPLVSRLFWNKDVINTDLIEQKLLESNSKLQFNLELKRLTLYLAFTFLVSAILNYVLTKGIVVDISDEFSSAARLKIRNEQIADLTWKSYIVILGPSLIMLSFILWKANSVIKKYTGLSLDKILIEK